MQFGSFGRLVVVSDRSNFDISEGRLRTFGSCHLGLFGKCGIPQKWPHEWEHMYDKPNRSEVPHCRTNPYSVQPWWPATHLRVCHHTCIVGPQVGFLFFWWLCTFGGLCSSPQVVFWPWNHSVVPLSIVFLQCNLRDWLFDWFVIRLQVHELRCQPSTRWRMEWKLMQKSPCIVFLAHGQ